MGAYKEPHGGELKNLYLGADEAAAVEDAGPGGGGAGGGAERGMSGAVRKSMTAPS